MTKGIENLKSLILALITIVDIVDDILDDGINFADIPELVRLTPVIREFRELPEVYEEIKDLTPSEQTTLLLFVESELAKANQDVEKDTLATIAERVFYIALHIAGIFATLKKAS